MEKEDQSPRQKSPIEIARQNLESIALQGIAGSNIILKNQAEYGTLGVQGGEATYGEAMKSEEIKEAKEAIYEERKKQGDELDVFGEPSAPNNYDASARVIRQLQEYREFVPLKELGDIVKGIAPGLKFSVPAELENYVPRELFAKIQRAQLSGKEVKLQDVLNEQEIDALAVYQGILSKAYNRAIALRVAQSGYFADLNQAASQISEKYKKLEKR